MINEKKDKFSVAYLEGREDILLELMQDITNEGYDNVSQVKGAIHSMIDAINKVKKDYV